MECFTDLWLSGSIDEFTDGWIHWLVDSFVDELINKTVDQYIGLLMDVLMDLMMGGFHILLAIMWMMHGVFDVRIVACMDGYVYGWVYKLRESECENTNLLET